MQTEDKRTLLKIFFAMEMIVESEQYSWEEKYDLIFSEDISRLFLSLARDFSPYDPDTSYQDDVMAFYNQTKEYVTEKFLQ